MTKLIDADALPKLLDAEYKQTMKLIQEGEKHLDTLAEGFTEAICIVKYIAPTVDAVPVVRCKDCKYGEAYYRMDGTKGIYCHCPHAILHYGIGSIFTPVRGALDFCSYGQRAEENNG